MYSPQPSPELLDIGAETPGWTLRDPKGVEQTLADYRGKVVVMDFWGTWCGPCIAAMPSVQRLHEKYGEHDVVTFGLSCNEPDDADPAKLMHERGFTYRLLLNGGLVARAYHVSGYPTITSSAGMAESPIVTRVMDQASKSLSHARSMRRSRSPSVLRSSER